MINAKTFKLIHEAVKNKAPLQRYSAEGGWETIFFANDFNSALEVFEFLEEAEKYDWYPIQPRLTEREEKAIQDAVADGWLLVWRGFYEEDIYGEKPREPYALYDNFPGLDRACLPWLEPGEGRNLKEILERNTLYAVYQTGKE